MLKLILGSSIFLISAYIGFAYGETFRNRQSQLKEILKALTLLQNDVIYGTTPLPEALENLSRKAQRPIGSLVKAISERLIRGDVESVYEGASEEYKLLKNEFYLSSDDKKVMEDFFKALGESGIYGQEKIFELAIRGIKVNLNDASESAKKNIKLYRYLGLCMGAMVVIFLI